MINLDYFKDELIGLFNVGYDIDEALKSVYEDFSGETWKYPRDLSDIDSMIKQEIKMLKWFNKERDVTIDVCTNYEKYFDRIISELKSTKEEIGHVLFDTYIDTIIESGPVSITPGATEEENEPIEDEEILEWLCEKN